MFEQPAIVRRPPLTPGIVVLRERSDQPGAARLESTRTVPRESDGTGPVLRCRACRFPVTDSGARIEIGGRHGHTFFNPHGLVFDIGCFSRAPGCGVFGKPSTEFTWFSGFAWRLAVCRGCGSHLGWFYSPEYDGSSFFGLIFSLLIEDEGEKH